MQGYHCNYVQGYLTGRPVPATDVAAIIMKRFSEKLKPQASLTTLELPAQRRLAD